MKTSHASGPDRPPLLFRDVLREELGRRCADNSRYSLRAFALDLGVHHATLSQLLSGRRVVTEESIRRIGAALGWSSDRVAELLERERLFSGPRERDEPEVVRLTDDAARVMHEWCHHAILELMRLASFRPDSRWIARVLGVSTDEVNIALSRLARLGMLTMEAPDRWVDSSPDVVGDAAFTRATLEHLLARFHDLHRNRPGRERAFADHVVMTLAVNTARLPDVAALIARFRRELATLVELDQHRDEVYQVQLTLLPITALTNHTDEGDPAWDSP